MISELRNKELGIIELIGRGWKVFKDNFISIFIITLIIDFPLDILGSLLEIHNIRLFFYIYLGLTFHFLHLMAVAIIVEQYILQGKDYSFQNRLKALLSALQKAFSSVGNLLGTVSFFAGLILLFSLLFIIPALNFIVNGFFLLETVTLRNQRGKAALSYSKSIVQGRWWKVFFLWVALLINLFIIVFMIFIITVLIDLISPSLKIFTLIISNLSVSLLLLLNQVFSTICFLNLDFCKK